MLRTAAVLMALVMAASGTAALPRSKAVRAEFVRTHPCPANGHTRGACPGWQVDHIEPLKCGGADSASNMQWLTVREHAEKTKREAGLCRVKRRQQS